MNRTILLISGLIAGIGWQASSPAQPSCPGPGGSFQPVPATSGISVDSLQASTGQCDGTVILPFTLYNTGLSAMPFSFTEGPAFWEGFESGLERWDFNGSWGLSDQSTEGVYALSDSPDGDYQDNADQYIEMREPVVIRDPDGCYLIYYLKVDMECCCDFFKTKLQVNGGSWATLATENCYQAYTFTSINIGPYVEAGDEIRIRFEFTADYSVNGDGIHLDELYISGTYTPVDWFSVTPAAGEIAPGDSAIIEGHFQAMGQPSGQYQLDLILFTGTPPVMTGFIPVDFNIGGVPLLYVEEDSIVFAPVQRMAVATSALTVYNDGCDTLHVISVSGSPPDFFATGLPLSILPYSSGEIILGCQPANTGSVDGTLTLHTDGGTAVLYVSGEGLPGPWIQVSPALFTVTFSGCQDSLWLPLTLYNQGETGLHARLFAGGTPAAPDCVPPAAPLSGDYGIHRVIFNTIDHSSDGLETGYEDYSDSLTTLVDAGETYLLTISRPYPWQPVRAWIDFDNDGTFNMGNELVLNHVAEGFPESMPPAVATDADVFGMIRIPYSAVHGTFLRMRVVTSSSQWSWPGPCEEEDGQYEDYAVMINRPVSLAPDSLTVVPGDSAEVTVRFSAGNLPSGQYPFTIRIDNNDLANPHLTVPVLLTLTGQPEIELIDTSFLFPETPEHSIAPDTLEVFNRSCGELVISQIGATLSAFTTSPDALVIPGYDSARILVRFAPADPGVYTDTLVLESNAGIFHFPLGGSSVPAAHLDIRPEQVSISLTGCLDSTDTDLSLFNPGSDTLTYLIKPSVDFYEDFEDSTLTGWTRLVYGQDTLWHITALDYFSPGHSLWCGVEFQGNYATGHQINDAIMMPPIDLTAVGPEETTTLRFRERYETESWNDLCRVNLSTDSGQTWNWLNGNGSHGDSDGWIHTEINLSSFHGNTIWIRFYFFTYNTTYNNYPGWFIDDVRISSTVSYNSWLSLTPDTGFILPGDSVQVAMHFTNEGLSSGLYQTRLQFVSNAPANPVLEIPVSLLTQGSAEVSLSDTLLVFPTVMQYTETERTFTLYNTGCDTLDGEFIQGGLEDFYIYPASILYLIPGDSVEVGMSFIATAAGDYLDTLVFEANIGDILIPLAGSTTPPPLLFYEPAQITLETGNCADSIQVPLSVVNQGQSPLTWQANILYIPVHRALNFNGANHYVQYNYWNPGSHWTLEAWVSCDSIWSGRRTVYGAVGNCQDWALTVEEGVFGLMIKPQSGTCQQTLLSGVSAVPGTWYHLAGACDGDSARIYLDGVLCNTAAVYTDYTGFGWSFIGKEYNSSAHHFDGTVDELRVWDHARTAVQLQENMHRSLTGNESGLIGYWDMNEISGTALIDKSPSQRNGYAVAARVNSDVPVDRFLLVSPSSGTVQPGDTAQVLLTLAATYMNSGTTTTNIMLVTNDPLHGYQTLPFTVTITGDPVIVTDPNSLDFGNVMQFSSGTDTLEVKNEGCDTLFLTGSYCTDDDFTVSPVTLTILPRSSGYLTVHYHPDSAGTDTALLLIPNNDSLVSVGLTGTALPAPHLVTVPDSAGLVLPCEMTGESTLLLLNEGEEVLQYEIHPSVAGWLQYTAQSGTLDAGASLSLTLQFTRLGMTAGLYTASIEITSNDPRNGTFLLPVSLDVLYDDLTVDLGPDTSGCEGVTLVLDAGPGYATYAWNDGSSGQTLTPGASGNYSVTATDDHGCAYADSTLITIFPLAEITLAGDTALCSGTLHVITPLVTGDVPPVPLDVTVGSGTQFTFQTGPTPFGTGFQDDRTQFLYTAAELSGAGMLPGPISHLSFNVGAPGYPAMKGFTIKMGTAGLTTLSGFVDGLTTVFSAVSFMPVAGWNTFPLDEPFYWDGDGSLVVEVCFDNQYWSGSSSVQYTPVPGRTWSQYCDDCGPGCSLSGGVPYDKRANIRFQALGEVIQYTWTGPSGYESVSKALILENPGQEASGTYRLTVENGNGCFTYDSLEVGILQHPVTALSGDDTLVVGSAVQISCSVILGEPPFSFVWSPAAGLNDPQAADPVASPTETTVYTVTATGANLCQGWNSLTLTVLPVFQVTGSLTYANSLDSPLNGASLALLNDNGEVIRTTVTANQGDFLFDSLVSANYQLEIAPVTPFGGVNATDALEISKHIVQLITLQGIRRQAADVNHSGTLTTADPLLVLRRTVELLDTFPAGDWTFQDPGFSLGNENTHLPVKALCMGDVNASMVPEARSSPSVTLATEGEVAFFPGQPLVLPVNISRETVLGALTLGFRLPETSLVLTAVQSRTDGLIFHTGRDGILRLAWQDAKGLPLSPGDALFSLVFTADKGYIPAGPVLSLTEGGELADPSGTVLSPVTLMIPDIVASAGAFSCSLWPNPFRESLTCRVITPEPGVVTLEITDLPGQCLKRLTLTVHEGGPADFQLDAALLPAGMYSCRVLFRGQKTSHLRTINLVKSN